MGFIHRKKVKWLSFVLDLNCPECANDFKAGNRMVMNYE